MKNHIKLEITEIFHSPGGISSYQLNSTELANRSACPACLEKKWQQIIWLGGKTQEESIKLCVCDDCSHVFYDKVPNERSLSVFYKKNWDNEHKSNSNALNSKQMSKLTAGQLQRFDNLGLLKDAKILDFGCGVGTMLNGLKELGFTNLFGIEPSQHRYEAAKNLLGSNIYLGNEDTAVDLAKSMGGFDFIFSNHVFEHIKDPVLVSKKLYESTNHRGKIMITVPEVMCESPIMVSIFLPHLHSFNACSLERMVCNAGFSAKKTELGESEITCIGTKNLNKEPKISKYRNNEDYTAKIISFLTAPFLESGNYVAHWHPLQNVDNPAGFRNIKSIPKILVLLILTVPKTFRDRIFRVAKRKNLLGNKRWIKKHRAVRLKLLKKSERPWLVTETDKAPFIIK